VNIIILDMRCHLRCMRVGEWEAIVARTYAWLNPALFNDNVEDEIEDGLGMDAMKLGT